MNTSREHFRTKENSVAIESTMKSFAKSVRNLEGVDHCLAMNNDKGKTKTT